MQKLITSAAVAALMIGQSALAEPLTSFDVAEDHTRIFMAAQPVHENGMPAYGNAFISQGYIYPAGTLDAETTGVLEDGSPAFPDLVLGTWTCDGYFVGEGGNATTGVWVISRQVFAFDDGETVVTQGTEIADLGKPNLRPITGATGEYASFDRGLIQTTLGFNAYMAINATYVFAGPEDDRASYDTLKGDAQMRKAMFENFDIDPLAIERAAEDWDSGAPVSQYVGTATLPNS